MTERPRYRGPQNLGQLWELSEDAQEIWAAYEELSDYVDKLPDPDTLSGIEENEGLLSILVQDIWGLISDTEDKTAEELSAEIQSALDSSWASW